MAADPGRRAREQSLLSAEELAFQLEGLAGPDRELPDRRFHELFEQRVRAAPGRGRRRARRPAVDLPGAQRPGQPDRRARCWRAGCAAEGVVAVVTERNLDWMASVIAIFKAGGVYLPIEPHFPADRIATTLAGPSAASC